jgi:hypothetical protein
LAAGDFLIGVDAGTIPESPLDLENIDLFLKQSLIAYRNSGVFGLMPRDPALAIRLQEAANIYEAKLAESTQAAQEELNKRLKDEHALVRETKTDRILWNILNLRRNSPPIRSACSGCFAGIAAKFACPSSPRARARISTHDGASTLSSSWVTIATRALARHCLGEISVKTLAAPHEVVIAPHAKSACRWGNYISARFARCLFATVKRIASVFLERLWTARRKPRITTIAATKRLQLRARGGCVFCLRLDGSVASGCPLTVGRAVLIELQRVAYSLPDAQPASPVIPTVILSDLLCRLPLFRPGAQHHHDVCYIKLPLIQRSVRRTRLEGLMVRSGRGPRLDPWPQARRAPRPRI